MILMQELIFFLKPDVIIETWVAHWWSLIYYSSLLELLWHGKVIGIDIDIRKHNRDYIEKHPMIKRVTLIEWSSVDKQTIQQVKSLIKPEDKVLVILDSDHRKPHVFNELNVYKDIVTKWSYMVTFDTFMPYLVWIDAWAHHQEDFLTNSAMNAVDDFLKKNKNFQIDEYYHKFYVSSCPKWFLKKLF
jgi:cephalosporin hydroxylase